MDTIKLYNIWKQKATKDPDLIKELENIENSPSEIDDRFYKELEFGTGGLRGVIGGLGYESYDLYRKCMSFKRVKRNYPASAGTGKGTRSL